MTGNLKSLTNEQFDELEGLIDAAEWLHRDAYPIETFYGHEGTTETKVKAEAAEIDIISYVDSLLVAKDAEIERLKSAIMETPWYEIPSEHGALQYIGKLQEMAKDIGDAP